ncbi:hypothetical protein BDN72DRAFT_811302 [Pluteus cervinus]|uniref:Uncharacterized protein n=1 Tax=Pluteus cervinus TaxID=181527 RepID=A0ACD3BBX9_9AGAR|nr:hypothetical protein BDN72DRAFT_811302 [Pluteus cervinus]
MASTTASTTLASRPISGAHLPLPEMLPVMTHVVRASITSEQTSDPLNDFFGAPRSSSPTRESRHDRRISVSEPLPPYSAEPLPAYTKRAEPTTLAQYLFKFGFLFPPFWILGALILASPLREPAPTASGSWLPEKTEEERQQIILQMREVEVKWALRCLFALFILIAVGVAFGLAAWFYLKN